MSARAARWVAWGSFGTAMTFAIIAGLFIVVEARYASCEGCERLEVLLVPGFGFVGALVASKTRNTVGWLLLGFALTIAVSAFAFQYAFWTVVLYPGSLPLTSLAAWVQQTLSPVTLVVLALILLVYPDGHLPSPRWRWVARTAVGSLAVSTVLNAVLAEHLGVGETNIPNPIHVELTHLVPFLEPVWLWVIVLSSFAVVLSPLVCAAAPFARRRHADEITRQQLRWFAWAVGATASTAIVGIAAVQVNGVVGNFVALVPLVGLAVAIPAAIGISILRYRLWDLDVVIKRALVSFFLVVLIIGVGVFAAILVGAAAIGSGPDSGFRDHPGALIAIGVAIGLAFGPLRRLARWTAQRVAYGRRATPYEVLSTFTRRIGETYAADDVLPRIAEVVGTATGAESCTVWLALGHQLVPEASWPDLDDHHDLPLTHDSLAIEGEDVFEVVERDELLGALSVRMPASEPMDERKEALIRDVAAQAALVLRNVRLVEDVRASRRRIVAAQDERAKKLERDIHDGAQQQLVALSVKQRLAAGLVGKDDERLRQLLSDLADDTRDALGDLRDLARGIYPPLLADKGLVAALEAQARKATIDVEVHAAGIARYPQALESAVYFCTLEAMNNVSKYADASRVEITLTQSNGRLTFAVTDDGAGFDPAETGYGTGIQGMADRLDAIGGSLMVTSTPSRGTTVEGHLPV